jgi:hypothetical protein
MKTQISRILNLSLWIVGSLLASTGLILAFRLPPGSAGGRGATLLDWGRHDWGEFHTWLAYAMITLVASHLFIHVRWLWVVACQRSWLRLTAGLTLGLALPIAALIWPVEHLRRGRFADSGHAIDISICEAEQKMKETP